jgi:peroxiredoxin
MAIVFTALAAALLGTLALQGWTLRQLRGQHGRLQQRLDDLTRRIATRAAAPVAAPAGNQAPPFDLVDLEGRHASLARFGVPAKPVLLVFTDPRCGPCYELLPDVGGWQRIYGDRLTIALISGGTPEANRAMTAEYGIQHVLLQADREVAEAFGVAMAPAAVVVHADGRIGAGPVYGARAVRELVAATLGLAMPEPPAREVRAARVGERAPAFRRRNLDGTVVDLAAYRGEEMLLLFWSPGCSHCQDLLPTMKAWEADADGPRLLVVSRGPVALNQDAGLRSPVVLDDDRSLADLFGVAGTPAAVVIDAQGVVASPVARGASGIRALVAQRFAPDAVAAD